MLLGPPARTLKPQSTAHEHFCVTASFTGFMPSFHSSLPILIKLLYSCIRSADDVLFPTEAWMHMQEIEATLRQSAQSTKGLMEAARILSTLKMATSQAQAQGSAEHASNTAFAEGIAQHAEQRVQDSSERYQQHSHTGTVNHRQSAGTCSSPFSYQTLCCCLPFHFHLLHPLCGCRFVLLLFMFMAPAAHHV